ncbi:MAG TPA: hypothetical protein VGH08_08250 [Chthoniobacterales bacterium]|jgi:hypothetical protein
MKTQVKNVFIFSLMVLVAWLASCDQSVDHGSLSSTPTTETNQEQMAQMQRERKSAKAGFNAGANEGIQCIGLAEYRHRVARFPSSEKLDRKINRALVDAQKSRSDLDASSFRSGYTAGFKAVLEDYSRDRNSAW